MSGVRLRCGELIYFIQVGEEGPIKVGYADNVRARLSGLQTANPEVLRLLVEIPGGIAEESIIHQAFDDCRIRGEWFRNEPKLVAYIQALMLRKGLNLPLGDILPSVT